MATTLTFKDLAQRIANSPPKHAQRIVAIDGGGGAGKTTFAKGLHQAMPNSYILTIDAFYRPPQLRTPVLTTNGTNHDFDWDRFRASVLEAVKNNQPVSYQRYDVKTGQLSADEIHVPRNETIIVEGVWSLQTAFTPYYDYCVWLEAPAPVRLQRGVLRDGEKMRQVWEEEFIPIDERYREVQSPQLRADCVVDSEKSDFEKGMIVVF